MNKLVVIFLSIILILVGVSVYLLVSFSLDKREGLLEEGSVPISSPVNTQTYVNERFGFTMDFPLSWVGKVNEISFAPEDDSKDKAVGLSFGTESEKTPLFLVMVYPDKNVWEKDSEFILNFDRKVENDSYVIMLIDISKDYEGDDSEYLKLSAEVPQVIDSFNFN